MNLLLQIRIVVSLEILLKKSTSLKGILPGKLLLKLRASMYSVVTIEVLISAPSVTYETAYGSS